MILNGKVMAQEILLDIKSKVKNLRIKPGLAAILVGNDPASELYVNLKEKA